MKENEVLILRKGFRDGKESELAKKCWEDVRRRKYYLNCTIVNNTAQEILWEDKYISSGGFLIVPEHSILAKTSLTFGVGGLWADEGRPHLEASGGGVSGGRKLQITDGPSFGTGFTNPVIGWCKAGVAMGGSAEDGYNAASSSGNEGSADGYTVRATIDNGARQARFEVSGGPERDPDEEADEEEEDDESGDHLETLDEW